MKKYLCIPFAMLMMHIASFAQCPLGYATASLNWDYLDFLDPSFAQNTLPLCQNQKFAFGTQTITLTTSFANSSASANPPSLSRIVGENNIVTAKTGTYSTPGDDVQFMGDGAITVTFQNSVSNLKFSIYDIDYNQKVTITALNGVTSALVSILKVSGSELTIAPVTQPAIISSATAAATTAVATSSTDGAINVDIAGPVTSFTVTVSQTNTKSNGNQSSQEDGSFWLSDIQACTSGSFSTNYRSVCQPWAGMPSYMIAVYNNQVYYTDPLTGKAKLIFKDPATTNINSVAYDPVNHYIYYAYSLTAGPATDKALRRYDYNMDTMGIVINDIGSLLGMPIYDNGVESGGASFYDGSLYLGIEGNGTGYLTGRESKIWKIDFNAAGVPVLASQVYGIDGNNHDWGDFGVTNGTLYDFDSDQGNENLYTVPLFSRSATIAVNPAIPKQTGIDWQENLYNIGNTGGNPSTGFIASYGTGGVQGIQNIITVNGVALSGSWGDAAEAFKPKLDFGDAPSSYDPNPATPAMHEKDTALHFGAAETIEWNKTSSLNANADANDDGLPFVQIIANSGNYYTDVDVYNNSGSNATVCAWVDFNNNGIFDIGEGITRTISSGPFTQRVQLFWPSVTTTLSNNSYTYLRIRVTSASNGMTAANSTGYFYNGEVEDYYVVVNSVPLAVKLTHFSAEKRNEQEVDIRWSVEDEDAGTGYLVQRSIDGSLWEDIDQETASQKGQHDYYYSDGFPSKPVSYYRLKFTDGSNKIYYSQVKKVQFSLVRSCHLFPNPASQNTSLEIEAITTGKAILRLQDIVGKTIFEQQLVLKGGTNIIQLNMINTLNSGVYTICLSMADDSFTKKLIVRK